MNILRGYPVYRADAGAVSLDPSHPEIRWRCSRNINLGKFRLIAPTHFKLPTTVFEELNFYRTEAFRLNHPAG